MADESSPARCMLIKILVALFVVGVGYHLLYYRISSTPANTAMSNLDNSDLFAGKWIPNPSDKSDHFAGKWIPNPSEPPYTNATCSFVDSQYNCMKNGRPDTAYLHWRWKPDDRDLPAFDAERFLSSMRNKSWAFVGDSVSGQHALSMLCILSQVELPFIYYHTDNWHSAAWRFPTYNFTLAQIWAPFLLKADTTVDENGHSNTNLHLDILERNWTITYDMFDHIVISGGQWFYKSTIVWENNKVIGCHYCPGLSLKELGYAYLYGRALQLALRFIVASDHKPTVVFRTWSPDHYEVGDGVSGGVCHRTLPYKEGQYHGTVEDHVMRAIEIEEFEKAAAVGNGVNLKLMDIFHLSLLRPDAHPGPYHFFHPFENDKNREVQNDCSHWCLPGLVETWNELVMEMAMNEESLRSAF